MLARRYLNYKNMIKSLTENQAKFALLAILAGKNLNKALELAGENLTEEDFYKKLQKECDREKELK